ncbi:MAG: pectinesterase family protein [Chitinophagaceae bacterium]
MKRRLLPLLLLGAIFSEAQPVKVMVDPAGKSGFITIQEAVNSLPDSSRDDRVIFVKNGIYREQVYIGKSHVVLQGESREHIIIIGAVADVIYGCEHPGDRNSGILNLDGNDITIINLTLKNTWGVDQPDSVTIQCQDRKTHEPKAITLKKTAHQFVLRSFKSTRLKVVDCTILGWGNDAVSPWNENSGMYYFKDCIIQGATDFYCPRGAAYAENCTFISLDPGTAAIWHDGHAGKDMKSVFVNCKFTGVHPYKLGRYHHDAQFFLVNCSFDKNLADAAIYKAASAAPDILWGTRAYYYNCHREAGDYEWFRNNMTDATGSPAPSTIDAYWAFGGKWNP